MPDMPPFRRGAVIERDGVRYVVVRASVEGFPPAFELVRVTSHEPFLQAWSLASQYSGVHPFVREALGGGAA